MIVWRFVAPGYYVGSGGRYVRWCDSDLWHSSGDWEYGTKRRSVHSVCGHSGLLLTAKLEAEKL